MKKIIISILLLIIPVFSAYADGRPYHGHEVYFEGTNFELHIFRVKGRNDGNTMLIIGGIQGDEPGGFLSADLYSDFALEKGNLIVVPRANMKSVILFNRAPEGDMNRLFSDKEAEGTQGEVVEKLKELMAESDIILNLHDGWGFHNPEYIDKNRNPKRFGQSIIIDENEYVCNGKTLNLKEMAERVVKNINAKIPDKNMHFHLFNTETGKETTQFKDMRKTATWYALTNECTPAFGIEGSKSLKSLENNILYHNYAVNEFMKIMDIIPEQPRVMIIKPEMRKAIIRINDETKEVRAGDTIYINKGDELEVSYIESNFLRGVTCDILGYGTLNDMGKSYKIKGSTKIVFRKDNHIMSEINVKTIKEHKKDEKWSFMLKVNNENKTVASGETIKVKDGSEVVLVKLFSKSVKDADIPLNLKGWVPNKAKNTGDDREYKIKMTLSQMMTKYSLKENENAFPVIAGEDKNPIAEMYIEIEGQ